MDLPRRARLGSVESPAPPQTRAAAPHSTNRIRPAHGLRRGFTLIGVGIVLGVVAGALLARVMSSYFWGVSANDPPTFVAGIGLLVLVGLTACAFPARRAIKVDPMVALRYE